MKEKTADIDILEEKEKEAIENLKGTYWYVGEEGLEENVKIALNLIEALIAENKELKEKYSRKLIDFQKEREEYEKDYIPKSKVEELLKEIQEEGQIAYKNFMTKKLEEDFEIDGAILQELGCIEGKLQSLLGKE